MTTSVRNNDYIAEILGRLASGKQPAPELTQKAIRDHKSIRRRLESIGPVVTRDPVKEFDSVADVLAKLKLKGQPPNFLVQKAAKYYELVKKHLTLYENGLTEKQIAEVGTAGEEQHNMSKDNLSNELKLPPVDLTQIKPKVDTASQRDREDRDLYKVIEANAKHISENKKLQEALDNANSVIGQLSEKIQEQTENDDIHRENNALKTELVALREEIKRVSSENLDLESQLVSAKNEIEDITRHTYTIKTDLQNVTDTNRTIITENWDLKKELGSVKDKLEIQSKVIQKKEESSDIESQLQNLKDLIKKLDKEKTLLKLELQSAKQEIEKHSRHLIAINNEKDRGKKEIEVLKGAMRTLDVENTGLKEQLNSAEAYVREQSKEISILAEKRLNSGPDAEYQQTLERQKDVNKHLSNENAKLNNEIQDLKNRLSALASHMLTADNPDIADLSNLHRPTNIAEQFRQVYDDEWTEAFEELDKETPDDETVPIETLATTLKRIDSFCIEVSSQQFDTLRSTIANEITYPKYQHKSGTVIAGRHRAEMTAIHVDITDRMLKDLRKSLGILSTGPLTQIFQQVYLTEYKQEDSVLSSKFNAFLAQAVKLVWMMKVQTPPMALIWTEKNETVDKDKFTYYTKRGDRIEQCVWPAIVLHENGPLMSKGIVQAV